MIYWMLMLDPLCRTPKCHAMFWHLQLACLARNFTCILNSSSWAISRSIFSLARRVTQKRKFGGLLGTGIDCLSVCTSKTASNFRAIWVEKNEARRRYKAYLIHLRWQKCCPICNEFAMWGLVSSVSGTFRCKEQRSYGTCTAQDGLESTAFLRPDGASASLGMWWKDMIAHDILYIFVARLATHATPWSIYAQIQGAVVVVVLNAANLSAARRILDHVVQSTTSV